MKLLILNGPNLNLLGKREPQIYGHETYDDLVDYCGLCGMEFGVELEVLQSNHEGILIDLLQDAEEEGFAGVVLNAAFSVSASFVFAGHMAFTMAFDSRYVLPVIVGKLLSGISAVLIAHLLYEKRPNRTSGQA